MRITLPVVVLIAAAAGGCADLRWQRAGTAPEALQSDLAACEAHARLNAGYMARPFMSDLPRVVGLDALGRPVIASHYRSMESERFLLEHDLTRACMHAKGYDLVPAEREAQRGR